MKIKFRIVSLALLALLATSYLVLKQNNVAAANLNNKYSFDKDKAKSISKDFVESIDLVERNAKHKNEFNKEYEQDLRLGKKALAFENDEVSVVVNDQGEPIVYMNKLKTSKETIKYKDKKLKKEDLENQVSKMADKFEKENKTPISVEELYNGFVAYKYARTYKGYKYINDFVLVTLDPSTGEIAAASKMFLSNEPKINKQLSEDNAKDIAIKSVGKLEGYKVDDIIGKDILIVNPNNKWTNDIVAQVSMDTRLAYSFTFKMIEPYAGELTVWIDAEDGKVLGGYNTK